MCLSYKVLTLIVVITYIVISPTVFPLSALPTYLPSPCLFLQGTLRVIHVSVDQGETWNMAQLPPVGHEQFYSILAANDDMVFMHVDEAGGKSA